MESINPKDIINLEPGSISFITMKNGTMVVLDESIPAKTTNNKNTEAISNEKIDNKSDSKQSTKKLIFEISPKITIDYKGESKTKEKEKDEENTNENNIKIKIEKSDFNKCSSISKNNNFTFEASKKSQNDEEQKKKSNIFEKFENLKPSFETKQQPILNNDITKEKKESENQSQIKSKLATNSNNSNNNSKSITQEKNASKENVSKVNVSKDNISKENASKVNVSKDNISKENASKVNVSKDNILKDNILKDLANLNNTTNKNPTGERKSIYAARRASRLAQFNRKDRNSIHVVCSLNIRGDQPYKINLIGQFNNLVDRLNELKMNDPEPEDYKRYYELYKYRDKDNGMIKNKNYEQYSSSKKSYSINKSLDFKNSSPFSLSASNFNRTKNKINLSSTNGFKNGGMNLYEMFEKNSKGKNNPINIKNKKPLYNSQIVLPSNNMPNNFNKTYNY